mgnify:FL=1
MDSTPQSYRWQIKDRNESQYNSEKSNSGKKHIPEGYMNGWETVDQGQCDSIPSSDNKHRAIHVSEVHTPIQQNNVPFMPLHHAKDLSSRGRCSLSNNQQAGSPLTRSLKQQGGPISDENNQKYTQQNIHIYSLPQHSEERATSAVDSLQQRSTSPVESPADFSRHLPAATSASSLQQNASTPVHTLLKGQELTYLSTPAQDHISEPKSHYPVSTLACTQNFSTPNKSPANEAIASPSTYPTYEDVDDDPLPTNQRFRSIREIMDATRPFEALMADLGPESTNILEDDEDDSPLEDITLTPKVALNGPESDMWKVAMQTEMDALTRNGTWTLVPRPNNRNIVSSKWVLTKKKDAHGVVTRYKARVVARGFSQIPGVDFKDTFAPTLKMVPLRTMLALSAGLNLELHHLDIETAFLHGDLNEEIFMQQPPFFEDPTFPKHVCKLHKSLYGLKQSPRMWHHKLHTFLVSINFRRLQAEPNLYIRKEEDNYVMIGVYVDDLPIASNSTTSMRKAIDQLKEKFPVKDLGPLEYCLGIKVTRNRIEGTLTMTQGKLVEEILHKFEMSECKPIATPMTVPCKLSTNDSPKTEEEEKLVQTLPYRQILGSIRYLVSCTRPDLSYSAGFLSRFMQNPGIAHWKALKRVLRYLQYTKDMGLTYKRFQSSNSSQLNGWLQTPLVGWTDSDWGGDLDTSRSTSGMVFTFAGGAIAWRTKRQASVALSSTEAEYIAAALTAKEGLWIKTIIEELDILKLNEVKVFCDNQSCIKLAINPKITDQNKHIRARHHFIRELVEAKEMSLHYTSTTTMWADFLTKPVPQQKHWNCCNKIGLSLIKTNRDKT